MVKLSLYDQPNGYIRHNNSGIRVDYPGVNDYTGRMVFLVYHTGGNNSTTNKKLYIDGSIVVMCI